jgi:hypothetical protein
MLGAIWQTIIFYARCIKWAAAGTVERANAWFWPVGVPIVALAGWYLGVGELHIPDQPPRNRKRCPLKNRFFYL